MDQKILSKIFDGEIYQDDEHLKTLHLLFQNNLEYYNDNLTGLGNKISVCKNDVAKIELVRNYFVWTPVPEYYFTRYAKSSKASVHFRQLGQDYFEMQCWKEALRSYSLALMFAESNEDFSQAFYNRAGIFLKFHKFGFAKRDYESSVKYCPEINLEQELTLLHSKSLKYEDATARQDSLDDVIESKYFKVIKSNSKIEFAAEFVRIEDTIERGRCLVANRIINAGEVILAQKPFAVLLKDLLVWDTHHCHFCYRPIEAGVPCNQCTFAIFCSEECLEKSQASSHQYEHKYFPYLNAIKSPRRDIMAAQIILKLGPSYMYQLYENWKTFPESAFDENGVYPSSKYTSIYHLVSHANQLKPIEKISNAFRALILLHLIDDKTNFFSQFYEDLKPCVLDNFKNFVASIILHHIENIPYNVISMSELVGEDEAVSYGMSLFSLLCLANHSCDPNAVPLRRPNSTKVSLIALKSMKPGDEIFISYSPLYTTMNTLERQEFLSKRYNFLCNCIPCENNWFMDLDTEIAKLKSSESYNNSARSVRCKKSELQRIYENLLDIESMISNRKQYLKALETLQPFLSTLTQNYSSRFPLTLFAQELMKKGLVGLVNQK